MGFRQRINSPSPATDSGTYQFFKQDALSMFSPNERDNVAEGILKPVVTGGSDGARTREPLA